MKYTISADNGFLDLLSPANYVQLRKAFKGWKAYCIQRQLKLATNAEWNALMKRKTLQKYFVKWHDNLQICRERKQKDAAALQHWKETVNRRVCVIVFISVVPLSKTKSRC